MTAISNDTEFKAALASLSLAQQRRVGSLFVDNVMDLADNPRLKNALSVAQKPDTPADEFKDAFRTVKSIAVETYTICGKDADWLRQASHFVAAAGAACLVPEEQESQCKALAWTAAMNARMARTCENIAHSKGEANRAAEAQYEILKQFLEAETA